MKMERPWPSSQLVNDVQGLVLSPRLRHSKRDSVDAKDRENEVCCNCRPVRYFVPEHNQEEPISLSRGRRFLVEKGGVLLLGGAHRTTKGHFGRVLLVSSARMDFP